MQREKLAVMCEGSTFLDSVYEKEYDLQKVRTPLLRTESDTKPAYQQQQQKLFVYYQRKFENIMAEHTNLPATVVQ